MVDALPSAKLRPYMEGPTDDVGIFKFYCEIDAAIAVAIIGYNIPQATGISVSVSLLNRLGELQIHKGQWRRHGYPSRLYSVGQRRGSKWRRPNRYLCLYGGICRSNLGLRELHAQRMCSSLGSGSNKRF